MHNIDVAVYANEVEGAFSDDTAALQLVAQFQLPNVGSSVMTLEYVLGQYNNNTRARFVEPLRKVLGRDLRLGDVIMVGYDYFSVVNIHRIQGEHAEEVERTIIGRLI